MRVVTRTVSGTLPTEPPLSEPAAEAWIPRTCFKNGPPSRIGVELELLVAGRDGLATHYPRHRYPHLISALDGGSAGGLEGRVTVEPGGQVELSSRPGDGLAACVDSAHRDLHLLHRRASGRGVRLVGLGVDPVRPPRRIAAESRYTAMERYFAPWEPAGSTMMCSTASVQVSVEASTTGADIGPADVDTRWDVLHAVGPTLVAAFANSPRRCGRPTGYKSTRQAIWHELDPARTGVPDRRAHEDVPTAWTRWALDAPLMLVRRDHRDWSAPRGLSFREWVRHGRTAVPDRPPPTADDLAYHLTTLFPQVRPRGQIEVRYLDAQPGCWWIVPTAVIAGLLGDAPAAERAREICEPNRGRWLAAARCGMDDPALAGAATKVLTLAAESLRRRQDDRRFADLVEGYLQRWTMRRRSPADDGPAADGTGYPCDGSPARGEGRHE